MRVADIEKVEKLVAELKKLRAAQTAIAAGPTNVRLYFSQSSEIPSTDGTHAWVDVADAEFVSICSLAGLRVRRDIDEITDALQRLGAQPEDK